MEHPTTFKKLFQFGLENSTNLIKQNIAMNTFMTTEDQPETYNQPDMSNPKVRLINDYENLYKTMKHADVTFEIGDNSIRAHASILSSKYFIWLKYTV